MYISFPPRAIFCAQSDSTPKVLRMFAFCSKPTEDMGFGAVISMAGTLECLKRTDLGVCHLGLRAPTTRHSRLFVRSLDFPIYLGGLS